jgi:glycosyltransferase involved in cell wall biosynthesis
MVSAPEVSIILPTQGRRPSLLAALRSALAQDFGSFEIVVVDDAVVDRAWRERPELQPLLRDPRVRIVPFHTSRGCAAAKNAGLRAAQGRWVCYLDDDNEYRPAKVSAQHALAVASGAPVVLCGIEISIGERRRRHRQLSAASFAGDDLLLGVLADTNVLFHRHDGRLWWDESLGTVDDACFFQTLIEHHALKRVPNVPEPLVIYRTDGVARVNRGFEGFYRGQRRLLIRWSRGYSARARRVLLLRALVGFAKYHRGGWRTLARHGGSLMRVGGSGEWRTVANAIGVKLPLLRRWMVT